MAIYQRGESPKEEKSIFPPGSHPQRVIFHEMAVVGKKLYVNAEDKENFLEEIQKKKEELDSSNNNQ